MPLYEYECETCAHRFERIQKFSDPPVEICPICSGAVRKLLSSPAIQFKGSGWYITDYARKSSSDGSKAGKEAGTSPESSAESKPASESSASSTAPSTPSPSGKSET